MGSSRRRGSRGWKSECFWTKDEEVGYAGERISSYSHFAFVLIGMSMMPMRGGMSSFAFIPIFVTGVLVTGGMSWFSLYLLPGGKYLAFGGGVLSLVSSVLGGLAMRSLPPGRLGRSFVISKTIAMMSLYVGAVVFFQGVMPLPQSLDIIGHTTYGFVCDLAFVMVIWLGICPPVAFLGIALLLGATLTAVWGGWRFIHFLFKGIMRIGSTWTNTQAGRTT